MQTCLPFILLNSSIPLTLGSDVSDPAFGDLKEGQRPESSLSDRRASVETQPPSTPSTITYRRFSKYENRRRAHSNPEGMQGPLSPEAKRPLSARFRKTRSAPTAVNVPLVHQEWVGSRKRHTRNNSIDRRVSVPVQPTEAMVEDVWWHPKAKRSSAPPQSWAGGSISPALSTSTMSSPRDSIFSSRFSTDSSIASSLSSPPFRSSCPPTPPLETLQEDEELSLPPYFTLPSLSFDGKHLDGLGIFTGPPSPPLYAIPEAAEPTPPATPDLSTGAASPSPYPSPCPTPSPNPQQTPLSRRISKKVSFSASQPEVIPAEELLPATTYQQPSAPLSKPSNWSGLFLLSAPPVAAKPQVPITRRTSLQHIRGQTAGRSILRRTSSFSTTPSPYSDDDEDEEREHQPGFSPDNERLRRLPRSKSFKGKGPMAGVPPQPPPFKFPTLSAPEGIMEEDEDDDEEHEFETARTVILTRPGQQSAALARPRFQSRGRFPVRPQNAIPAIPQKPERAFSLEQKQVRHWSMHGGSWVRRSGSTSPDGTRYVEGNVGPRKSEAPPVPPLPTSLETLRI